MRPDWRSLSRSESGSQAQLAPHLRSGCLGSLGMNPSPAPLGHELGDRPEIDPDLLRAPESSFAPSWRDFSSPVLVREETNQRTPTRPERGAALHALLRCSRFRAAGSKPLRTIVAVVENLDPLPCTDRVADASRRADSSSGPEPIRISRRSCQLVCERRAAPLTSCLVFRP